MDKSLRRGISQSDFSGYPFFLRSLIFIIETGVKVIENLTPTILIVYPDNALK